MRAGHPGRVLGDLRPRLPDVRRVAVLRANGIGDLVVALPALEAVRAAYPGAEITYLGREHHASLLRGRPSPVDRAEVVPPYAGVVDAPGATQASPAIDAFLAGQRARRYDLALQLHGGGGYSNALLHRLGARTTAGSRADGAAPLDLEAPYAPHQHEVLRFLDVAALVGAAPVVLQPRLAVTGADRAAAAAALEEASRAATHALAEPHPHAAPHPLVVLHAGSTDVRRRWPAACFAAVADALAADGAAVVLVGSADEAATTGAVRSATRAPLLDLTGRLDLPALLGVLDAADLLVGNDSGPRHLAEAVGTPTVGVYRIASLAHAPLTRRRHRVAVAARTTCPVCSAPPGGCRHERSWVADVPVEEVLGAARALLAGG